MKKKRLQKKTCFALGIGGAALWLAAGVMVAANIGPANFVQMACLALTGAMLLFLATLEKGQAGKGRRVKLLLLFLALLAAYLRLWPMDLLEVLVIPLMLTMYRKKGDAPFIVVAWVAEAGMATVRTLALTPLLGASPQLPVGLAMVVLGLVRGLLLARAYRAAAAEPPIMVEDATRSLR